MLTQLFLRFSVIFAGLLALISSTLLAFPPQTDIIAFNSRNGRHIAIFVLDVARGQTFSLSQYEEAYIDVNPAWSPDGEQIIFSSSRAENYTFGMTYFLYTMSSTGREVTLLDTQSIFGQTPVWSPDGERVAFTSRQMVGVDIYVMNRDGSDLRNLTNNDYRDLEPDWSPDGKRLVFASQRNDQSDIYVLHVDSGELRQLTNDESRDRFPVWSPDGERIAFVSNRASGENDDLFVMDADGRNIRRLTDHPTTDEAPDWSADGQKLAYQSVRDGRLQLFTVDIASGEIHPLWLGDAWYAFPRWRPD